MAKRIRYGGSATKSIYIAPDTEDHKTWEDVIDHAMETGEGAGALLMQAWRNFRKKLNQQKA
jgi:hypothetical protein